MSGLPICFTASFWLLSVQLSDLVAICTVDKVKDGGACRKSLLNSHNLKIEIVLPEKLIKKILTDKQEREKNRIN